MNKARRHELKMLKFKKRMKKMRGINPDGKYHAYRSHSTPCSCFICSHDKYIRARVEKFGKQFYGTYGEIMSRLANE